ncbi:DUF799 family lipoprotein [Vibrio sp. PP-XX7]
MIIVYLSGCSTPKIITKQEAFPDMYQQKPNTILVVPAVNRSTAADAPELYATTILQPLAEAGYYVLPIPLINQQFAAEGIVDGEQLKNVDIHKFKQMYGADAVLFVTINQWDTNYFLTSSNVTVGATFDLVSTRDGRSLWHYKNKVVVNITGNTGSLLGDIISTAVSTAITDYVPIAHQVNASVISTLPFGHYHTKYLADGGEKVVDEALSKEQPQEK